MAVTYIDKEIYFYYVGDYTHTEWSTWDIPVEIKIDTDRSQLRVKIKKDFMYESDVSTYIYVEYNGKEYSIKFAPDNDIDFSETFSYDYKKGPHEVKLKARGKIESSTWNYWYVFSEKSGLDSDEIVYDGAGSDTLTISWQRPNEPPTATISASNTVPGKNANVSWRFSDPEGDSVATTSLKRYIKAKSSSTWVSSNISVSSSATSYSDAIPAEYRGGEVYWEVGFRDSYYATGTAKSPTYSLNTAPTGTINVSGEIKAGESVDITWTASDADGDTVSTSQLIRYLKKKGESSYTATTLISNGGVVRSYRDVIPEDAGEGSIYYAVVLSDGSLSTTINSSAQAVERSCSLIGSVNIGGVNREITEAYVFIGGVAREVVGSYANINGVWKPMF